MDFETVGEIVDQIPVRISYRIIELFSAGLYSSPSKAFEELVSNSYDAGATEVCVRIDLHDSPEDSLLWVCDNGEGMNLDGLKEFWKIGSSGKRIAEKKQRQKSNRLAIGRFGIGKLATYILTKKLTLISKTAQGYYAVTMDYSKVNKDSTENEETLNLAERKLSLAEVKSTLSPLITVSNNKLLTFNLWGSKAEKSWTFAIMSDLKPKANEIGEGRLKWILSTALPLNPSFNLRYNGVDLKSSKEKVPPTKIWVFGKSDKVAARFKEYDVVKLNGKPAISMPSLKNITGQLELYKDSLLKEGKSEKWGRSHGIFLMVRGRLINLDDALLGMDPLSHGVFNRVRIIVNADELDEYITSTRESIKESHALSELRGYIQRKFLEAKDYHFNATVEEEKKNHSLYKIANAQSSLIRLPILNGARKFLDGKISNLFLTQLPVGLNKIQKEELVGKLENDLMSESGLIKAVSWEALKVEDPIAKLDLENVIIRINLLHPFFSNFIDDIKSPLPFELIAITEIVNEFHLLESGLDQDSAMNIMKKRDETLRELTFSDKLNAPVVAALLQSSVANPTGLEDSISKAFASLGFETTPIGGKGKPDGLAVAIVGPQKSPDNYSITYDAKSTKNESIKAMTAHISGVSRHREDYKANYACVIAIDFEGADDPLSAVNKEAKMNNINLITVSDFIILVILAGPKQLGFKRMRSFFDCCHTTLETSKWISEMKKEVIKQGPIKELLETAYKIMKEDSEPPDISSLRHNNPELKKLDAEQIKNLVQSLATQVPNYVGLTGNVVSIQAPPARILEALRSASSDIPADFRMHYVNAFGKATKRNVTNKKKSKNKN